MYVVRHCEALGNLQKTFQGQINHDITEIGAKQLQMLSKRFEKVKIDAVYASPLIRAHKTALSVAEPKGLEVHLHNGLKELNVGMFENMPYEEFFSGHKQYSNVWLNSPQDFFSPKGESMRDLYQRVWQAVTEIAAQNSKKTVIIASHGCAIRNLLCRVLYNDINRLGEIGWADNTAVSKLVFDDALNCRAEYIFDVSHLPPELLPQKSKVENIKGDKK